MLKESVKIVDGIKVTFKQIKEAEQMGEYKETSIDQVKKRK